MAGVIQRVACPVLVSRDEQMLALEDALLAANRGEGRFVAVAGEAGMGKTRLVTELSRRAHKLGAAVLYGGCSEVDLSLPYLPFVEAIGNYLATGDVRAIAGALGPAAEVLAQIFPQLGPPSAPAESDPGSAKIRLFEAVASLLAIPARERGLLFIVDDVHWADASTRELLDHLARRLPSMRTLCLVTYRSDEIDRRHPLLPTLQAWRRSRLVETIDLDPLSKQDVVAMLRAILEETEISPELADLMHDRCEGNPFVLEEMLREAIDRGDLFRTASGWDCKPIEAFGVPNSVRDAIILRLGRLEPSHVPVLEAAAILGRRFDHVALSTVADVPTDVIDAALTSALAQQLIDEDSRLLGGFRWRHALTQEAIYDEIVISRRQRLHSRAADALAKSGNSAERAHHLLAAGRFAEAVEESKAAAAEAGAASAYEDEVLLLERIVPYFDDEFERAEIMCRLGVAYAAADRPTKAADALGEGIRLLESHGETARATHFRLSLGRTWWVLMDKQKALTEYEHARAALEPLGPSSDLAMAYFRIGSQHLFDNDFQGCADNMRRAIEVAEQVGADRERNHAMSFLGLAQVDLGDPDKGFATIDEAYTAALAAGHLFVAANSQWNAIWLSVHLMVPGAERLVERLESVSYGRAGWNLIARSYVRRARGDLGPALDDAAAALAEAKRLENAKLVWRAQVQMGEVLAEMGRVSDALAILPWPPQINEAQDHVYEGAAQVRTRLAAGKLDEALVMAELILDHRDLVANYGETIAAAVEAFMAAGDPVKARSVLGAGARRAFPTGGAWLREAEARILLASGEARAAVDVLLPGIDEAERALFCLAATRMRVLAGRAAARAGDVAHAESLLRDAASAADDMGAGLLAGEARTAAVEIGVAIDEALTPSVSREPTVPVGERMISSMFADIRGYTSMTAATPPEALTDRLTSFYRAAKAEVERNAGVVDKFAGDAVMATFNMGGTSVDHPLQALRAALGLRDRASLMDLPVGIGIAVGPAVVGSPIEGANSVTMGSSVNLAARLQTAATAGQVILSEEAHRRVASWLEEHGLNAERDELTLKGFEGPQVVYRVASPQP